MKNKAIHDINTFMATDSNETILIGSDENGKDIQIVFSTIELLEWLDIDYMKNKAKQYIDNI
jgi:hypothetical protein